jgi:hypothetical protein
MTDVRLTASTTDGEVVPVLANAKGELLLEEPIAPPEFDGNLDGDLNVSGSADFAGSIALGGPNQSTGAYGIDLSAFGYANYVVDVGTNLAFPVISCWRGTAQTIKLEAGGSAVFEGQINALRGIFTDAPGNLAVRTVNSSTNKQVFGASGSGVFIGDDISTEAGKKIELRTDGSSEFNGDVVIGSKGSKWLIRESNGVAMLIEQTRSAKEPRIEEVRDLPRELDLVEAALNEIMGKLRMTPPAGWPVWDGSNNP